MVIVGVIAAREMETLTQTRHKASVSQRRKGEIGCLFTLQMGPGGGGATRSASNVIYLGPELPITAIGA